MKVCWSKNFKYHSNIVNLNTHHLFNFGFLITGIYISRVGNKKLNENLYSATPRGFYFKKLRKFKFSKKSSKILNFRLFFGRFTFYVSIFFILITDDENQTNF
ncbi:hypothetical protein BpHYR1_007718 [Brachionus plicatilis]|uniref:Uncharacterized protein n=1 Tax=Brachionus plicatilis TaxID=10195 RepID=A0A3M7PRN7_BRAPC|nr:hypothetical protein BpHYR1_007718 [Brachionus plicatilis]